MIKYISYLFYALLSVFAFASCAQHEGTEPGNDGSPKVTVYTFKPGAPYNADNDLQLRLATNSQTSEVYYLAELASQKETNVASMGEYGYMDYVEEKGKKVEGLGGNSSADIVVTDMIGTYSITIVAVNGGDKTATTVSFMGIEWNAIGEGTYNSTMFKKQVKVQVYKAAHADWYKLPSLFEEGKNMVIKMDGANATVEQQNVATDTRYGDVYATGGGTLENGVITLTLQYTCSAGSFGSYTETLQLPQ
jgi:hypothetical protein